MLKRAIVLMWIGLILMSCGDWWNPLGGVKLETTSELGPNTLQRIDNANQLLEKGVDIGPETRQLAREFNATLKDGLKFGFDNATLQKLDSLLRLVEDGLKIGIDQETQASLKGFVDMVDKQPEQWKQTISDIIKLLESSGGTLAKQMANEATALMAEATRNAQYLMGVTGAEFRCNVDFLGSKADDTLDKFMGKSLIARLRAILSGKELELPMPTPWICLIIPDRVQLAKVGNLVLFQGKLITITGYGFKDNIPKAFVVNERDEPVEVPHLYPTFLSDYQMQLNLQEKDFGAIPAGSKLVFEWDAPPTTYSMVILVPDQQAMLEIVALTANIYAGPGENYQNIGVAEQGASYPVIAQNASNTWWQIDYNGKRSWVADNLVKRNDITVPVSTDIPIPPPTAEFRGEPAFGQSPLNTSFIDLSSGTPTVWLWDFGDNTTSAEANPQHLYSTPGSYTVKLKVSNASGTDTEQKQNYVVVSRLAPVASFEAEPTTGEAPLKVVLRDRSTGDPTNWFWDFGDGETASQQNPTHVYEGIRTYTVTLTISNDQGSNVLQKSDYIVVNPRKVVADFTATVQEGESPLIVDFTDKTTGVLPFEIDGEDKVSMVWNFGDGQSVMGQDGFGVGSYEELRSVTHKYVVPGRYTVTLAIQGKGGSDVEVKQDYITVRIPKKCDYLKTRPAVNGQPIAQCPAGYLVKGVKCYGDYCDQMELLCCPYRHDAKDDGNAELSPSFSDEGTNKYISQDGFIQGVLCWGGKHCDNLKLLVRRSPSLKHHGEMNACYEAPPISEETEKGVCGGGYFVAGMTCGGDYCDLVTLTCCEADISP